MSAPDLADLWQPDAVRFYQSGAAALAAAIAACIVLQAKQKPEVILPAYSCPELISAVLYAGASPVLVDLAAQRPWICLSQLRAKINSHTVAVIAVSLFGIAERVEEISKLAREKGVLVIQDNAQSLPRPGQDAAGPAGMTVISFGRGKPISLLGGGAVLFREQKFANALARRDAAPSAQGGGAMLAYRIKVSLYNLLLSPYLYWLPHSLPFLKLGETRFAYLREIAAFPAAAKPLMRSAIQASQRRGHRAQSLLADLFARLDATPAAAMMIDLARSCCQLPQPDLLRYPVLFEDQELRDRAFAALDKAGLGISRMYQRPLPEIPGLELILREQGNFPNAARFSSTLLTFPTHEGVTARQVEKMEKILRAVLGLE